MNAPIAKTLFAAAFAALSASAIAQSEAQSSTLEEIIVTAERRQENLQDIPVAVTALTAATIEKQRVEELSDIAALTPNFTIGQQSPTQPELTLRGIGSTDREAGSDRSVVVFVDEVYIGRAGASTFDLFDLERIEVLRGPQGTLYGRNVVGGAINLITARPSQTYRAKLEAGLGSENLFEVKGLINDSLSPTVSGKVAASIKSRDGFYTFRRFNDADELTGTENSGATSSQSLRGQLLFEPSDSLDVLGTLEISSDEVDGVPSQVSQGATTADDYVAGLTPFYLGGADSIPDDIPLPFTVENNEFGNITRDSLALYAKVNSRTPYGTWTFIPAYRSNDLMEFRDIAGIKIRGNTGGRPKGFESTATNDEAYTALSFEARLASDPDLRAKWVAGFYYLSESIDRDQIRERQANQANSRPLFAQSITTASTAVFGQINYDLIPDRLQLTAGGRFISDGKDFDMQVTNTLTAAQQAAIQATCTTPADGGEPLCQVASLNPATEEYRATASDSWSEFTPKIALDYRLNPNWLLYASLSQGFKSGGFVGLAASRAAAEISFAPETADNFELGFKANLVGNRLQINTNLFMIDFTDLQLRRRILLVPDDPTSAIVTTSNAAEAEISGVEMELRAILVEDLSLSLALSTLDSEVVRTEDPVNVTAGRALPRAPESKINLGLEYLIRLAPGELELGLSLLNNGEMYYDINELAAGLEPAYSLINARATWVSNNNWSASLWLKNLSDETYRSHVQSIRTGRAAITQYGDPMTVGVNFKISFGG